MSQHVADEDLVEYLDGTTPPERDGAIEPHLGHCPDCRERLADLARFDHFVQRHQPVDETALADMFAVSERLLRAPRAVAPTGRRRFAVAFAAAAAALLLVVSVWWSQRGAPVAGLGFTVTRYAPPDLLRSALPERFHVDAALAEPAFVVLLARFPSGDVAVLQPDGDAARAPAGPLRLPRSELLDWEYPGDRLPRELLAVLCPTAPSAALLDALRGAWAAAAPGTVPELARADGRRAECLPFPAAR